MPKRISLKRMEFWPLNWNMNFPKMGGWEAETEAGKLLQGLGLSLDLLEQSMAGLPVRDKVKVLLAQALFGQPDIILLDEPTNHLDNDSITWLEDFLMDYPGTVIVVSHDRHFLNNVCTHIVDVDYNQIKIYVGNYDFWYESSQLMQRLIREQNRKVEIKSRICSHLSPGFRPTNPNPGKRPLGGSCWKSCQWKKCRHPQGGIPLWALLWTGSPERKF